MDYEHKYKAANNKVAARFGTNVAKEIFSDLYESEDERIRKALIDFFEDWRKNRSHCWGIAVTDILSWLEKQGEPRQHLELKAGNWYICHRAYCCRADHLTVKEGERFQCEKDGIVKGFVVKEPEKYFKECSAPATTECNYIGSDDVRRRSTIQVLEYARSLDAYNQYGKADIDKNIAWLEKQGSIDIDIESMVSSYKQRLKSQGQGNLENNPLINMCVSAFKQGVENTLEELNLKKL